MASGSAVSVRLALLSHQLGRRKPVVDQIRAAIVAGDRKLGDRDAAPMVAQQKFCLFADRHLSWRQSER